MGIVYLNGRFLDQLDAGLDPLDRGVLLGDGVFESIRCEQGQLLFHVGHFARLARSARIVHLPWNMTNEDLLAICQQVLDANNLVNARLRVTVTRGDAPGLDLTVKTAPTLVVSAMPFDPELYDNARAAGYTAALTDFPKNHHSPLAEVKSTSYQEHLLARHRARAGGADEGIFLNTDGLIAEGTTSNVFIVRDGTVRTPPVEDGALPGIIRLKVGLLCTRIGMEYVEESITVEDLRGAEEAFLTNALIEVMPLIQLNGQPIAEGKPGLATMRLYREHRRDVAGFLEAMRTG